MHNVGPTSKTLGRRCTNVIQMFRAHWVEREEKRPYPITHAPKYDYISQKIAGPVYHVDYPINFIEFIFLVCGAQILHGA